MTSLSLDLRGPILVVAGAFNPAIFTQNWIATNVFGIAPGTEFPVLEVIVQVDPQSLVRLAFINGVALNVAANRLELFLQNGAPETLTALEATLARVLELLPHTPIQAVGCNFRWTDTDPSSEIVDLFDTPEGLEGKFEVQMRQFGSQIVLPNATLNFVRAINGTEAQFNFNYNRLVSDGEQCVALLDGLIASDLAHGINMMQTTYHYDDYETLAFAAANDGENADAAEADD